LSYHSFYLDRFSCRIEFFMLRICFLFVWILTGTLHAKTIYFVPYPGTNGASAFFGPHSSNFPNKWVCLREALEKDGFRVQLTQDAENLEDFYALISLTNIHSKLQANLGSYPPERCWLLVFEPPVVFPSMYQKSLTRMFGKIFVMFDDLIDHEHYLKFYYPQPMQKRREFIPDFSQKKFCVLMAHKKHSPHPQELYSEREKIISFFTQLKTDELDVFGDGWEGVNNWKGVSHNKYKTLQNYKFCICYENMKDQLGYITEKIFDCFVSGCVPVYWGASNISDYIPSGCFIDRRNYATDEELYRFLKGINRDQYEDYLQAIRVYLSSSQSQLFSVEHFIGMIRENLSQLEPH
jgi:alpha(1,3/1,4) fucosyltransferase